jgi:hypothetical protein
MYRLGKRKAKRTHEGLFTDRTDDFFRRFIRLGLALGTLRRVLVGVALTFLLGFSTLYKINTRGHVGKRWKVTYVPHPRCDGANEEITRRINTHRDDSARK